MNTQLRERLAALSVDMPAEVADMHLEGIAAALLEAPVAPRRRHRRVGWRRRATSVMGAVFLAALPGGTAIAAEGAVPGDLLYPVKQLTEAVRSWFDPTVAADHRIDELETELRRDATDAVISDRLREAEAAVAELDDPVVTDRLHRLRDSAEHDRAGSDAPGTDEPAESQPRPAETDRRDQQSDETTTTSTLVTRDEPAATSEDADVHPAPSDTRTTDRHRGD